jgi:cell wall-associated NlpC family hydrolase
MTTARTSTIRHPFRLGRRSVVAALVGAGVMLTPLPALANAPAPTASISGPVAAPTHAAQVIVDTALGARGRPYVWGGTGPYGYDCSGLVVAAARAAGISMPHSARMQSTMGVPVSRAALRPGDLVFFYSPVSHVGIYIGNGQIVHAPTFGDVVKVSDIAYMGLYAGARRIA